MDYTRALSIALWVMVILNVATILWTLRQRHVMVEKTRELETATAALNEILDAEARNHGLGGRR